MLARDVLDLLKWRCPGPKEALRPLERCLCRCQCCSGALNGGRALALRKLDMRQGRPSSAVSAGKARSVAVQGHILSSELRQPSSLHQARVSCPPKFPVKYASITYEQLPWPCPRPRPASFGKPSSPLPLYTLAMSAAVYSVHAARWARSNHRVTMQDLQDAVSQLEFVVHLQYYCP